MESALFPWFAVRTYVMREQHVGLVLRNKGYTEFVPVYRTRHRWSDRDKEVTLPLFPGYLFCRLDPRRRLAVLTTPGVKCIVGTGKTPVAVAESEVEAIRSAVTAGLDVLPWDLVEPGQKVRLEGGPLDGVEGVLIEVKKRCRLVVSVALLQRSAAVEVDRSWVRPMERAAGNNGNRAPLKVGTAAPQAILVRAATAGS